MIVLTSLFRQSFLIHDLANLFPRPLKPFDIDSVYIDSDLHVASYLYRPLFKKSIVFVPYIVLFNYTLKNQVIKIVIHISCILHSHTSTCTYNRQH